jgi:chemotaxis protein CheC
MGRKDGPFARRGPSRKAPRRAVGKSRKRRQKVEEHGRRHGNPADEEADVLDTLDDGKIDALREVCNVGAGHAATALSQLIGRRIDLEVPKVLIVDISRVPDIAGGADAPVAGLFFQILGEARGHIFMIFPEKSARLIVGLACGEEEVLDLREEIHVSAMREVGNILASAFLSAISQLSGLNLIPSVPGFAHDMAGSILDHVLIELSMLADKALVIETLFKEVDEKIESHFFLLPDPHTLTAVLKAVETGQGWTKGP